MGGVVWKKIRKYWEGFSLFIYLFLLLIFLCVFLFFSNWFRKRMFLSSYEVLLRFLQCHPYDVNRSKQYKYLLSMKCIQRWFISHLFNRNMTNHISRRNKKAVFRVKKVSPNLQLYILVFQQCNLFQIFYFLPWELI